MPDFGQHFVLTIGRSGSNTLVNALNQHPQVLNYGEVLGDWNTIRKLYNRLPAALTSGEAAYLDAVLHNPVLARALNGYRNLSYLRRGGRAEMKRFGRRGHGAALPERMITFQDIIEGTNRGRTSAAQITYSERGNLQGAQFWAVGGVVYEKAKAAGLGNEVPTEWFIQDLRD